MGRNGLNWLCACAVGAAVVAVVPAARGLTVDATSTGVRIELGTVAVNAAPTVLIAPALFGNSTGTATGQVLIGPGHGFPDMVTASGVATVVDANTPTNVLTVFPVFSSGSVPLADGGSASAAVTVVGTPALVPGGGGILWGATTAVQDRTPVGTGTVSISSGTADYHNLTGVAVPVQSGLWWAASGFVPDGSIGASAINGSVISPTGAMVTLNPVVFAVSSNPGAGRVAAGTQDFVQAGGMDNFVVTPTVAGTTNFGALNDLTHGISETRVDDVVNNLHGIAFTVFGISLGPAFTFQPGDAARTVVTATLFGDPGADLAFDPTVLPVGVVLPNYGASILPIPEPASIGVVGFGVMVLLRRRRR